MDRLARLAGQRDIGTIEAVTVGSVLVDLALKILAGSRFSSSGGTLASPAIATDTKMAIANINSPDGRNARHRIYSSPNARSRPHVIALQSQAPRRFQHGHGIHRNLLDR